MLICFTSHFLNPSHLLPEQWASKEENNVQLLLSDIQCINGLKIIVYLGEVRV